MLHTFSANSWDEQFSQAAQQEALTKLESGHILFLPSLPFTIQKSEQHFLATHHADPRTKNISYQPQQHKLWGVQNLTDEQHIQLKTMMERFSKYALNLVKNLFPNYANALTIARTSFRPMQISDRKTSPRKDDKKLHVDAFPSAPNQGKRILRVFSNVNPHQEARVWRVGEPFEKVAERFIPQIKRPMPGSAAALRMLKITKSYRTLYDHYMLQIHDRMKADADYQRDVSQQEIHFPSGSTWIVQTDHVSHAALRGQYVFEQTFYLPISAMQNPSNAPVRILEKILGRELV